MQIDWQQILGGPLSSLAVGAVSAIAGARWAIRRFQTERWWEKKVEAYTKIARALFLMKRYIDAWIYREEMRVEHSDEYKKQLQVDWAAAVREVDEATVLGSFIISPAAAEILSALKKERDRADIEEDFHDQALIEVKALDVAIPAFTAAARKDLGLKPIAV